MDGNELRPSDIRKKILKQRGVEFKRLSRKPVPVAELPSAFTKSTLMRLTEMKFKDRLENLIFTGTIYDVEKRIKVDASTISKWRKLILHTQDEEFFNQFKEE